MNATTRKTDIRRILVLARRLGEFLDAQSADNYTREDIISALETALAIERALSESTESHHGQAT